MFLMNVGRLLYQDHYVSRWDAGNLDHTADRQPGLSSASSDSTGGRSVTQNLPSPR